MNVLPGVLGRLRKGTKFLQSASPSHSWKRKCAFKSGNIWRSWLVCFDKPFRLGCWLCHTAKLNTRFAKFQVDGEGGSNLVQLSDFVNHSKQKVHKQALEKYRERMREAHGETGTGEAPESEGDKPVGVVSGLSLQVPRLDKWVAAVNTLISRSGYSQQETRVQGQTVGSALLSGGDGSTTVVKKMYECLRAPLDEADLHHLKTAVATSVAIDKHESDLVVYARCLTPSGIYDCLLGLEDDTSATAETDASRAVLEALRKVIQRACTKKADVRRSQSLYCSPDDELDQQAFDNFCNVCYTQVADGGPNEQRALYEASPHIEALAGRPVAQALFKNSLLITRDRSHRLQSVDRFFFNTLPPTFKEFMDKLVTGPRSLCKMMQTSTKFSKLFKAKQADAAAAEDSATFARSLKNFSYAEQRFDSRKRPLFRLFTLLGVAIDCLEEIASAGSGYGKDDRAFAASLLEDFGGDTGYCRVVGAAVAADALIASWPFLKLTDQANADFALAAPAAAECLEHLRHLLKDGGLFLAEARGTLTHSVLQAMRSRMVVVARGGGQARAVSVGWPAPDGPHRSEPLRVAQKSGS